MIINPNSTNIKTGDLVLVRINESICIRQYKGIDGGTAKFCQFMPQSPTETERLFNLETDAYKFEIYGKVVYSRKKMS